MFLNLSTVSVKFYFAAWFRSVANCRGRLSLKNIGMVLFDSLLGRVVQRGPQLSLPFRFRGNLPQNLYAQEQAGFAMFEWLCKPSC